MHAPTIRCTEILISSHLGPKRFRGGYRGICGARRGKRQSDFWTVDGYWVRAARWYLSTVDQVVNFQLVVSFDPYFCETHTNHLYISHMYRYTYVYHNQVMQHSDLCGDVVSGAGSLVHVKLARLYT